MYKWVPYYPGVERSRAEEGLAATSQPGGENAAVNAKHAGADNDRHAAADGDRDDDDSDGDDDDNDNDDDDDNDNDDDDDDDNDNDNDNDNDDDVSSSPAHCLGPGALPCAAPISILVSLEADTSSSLDGDNRAVFPVRRPLTA